MADNESCPICHVPCKDFIPQLKNTHLGGGDEIFQYRELKDDTMNTPQQKQMYGHAINIGIKDIEKRKTEAILGQLFRRLNVELRKINSELDKCMKRILRDAEPAREVVIDGPRHDLAMMLSNILSTSFDDLREQTTLAKFRLVEQLKDTIDQL